MNDHVQWTWTDGWLLMALYLAGNDQGAELSEIIAAADATNHAIPTEREMSRALTKFVQCGLIREEGERYAISSSYLESIEKAYGNPGGLFASGDKGVAWLQETRPVALRRYLVELTEEHMKVAYDRYIERLGKKR